MDDDDDLTTDEHHKVDEWGLPYFVDEWGIQTETDEEPPAFDSGGYLFIPSGITTGTITSGSITTSRITVTQATPVTSEELAEYLSRTVSRKLP